MSGEMKSPLIPISWGELLDKITILQIKASKIVDAAALRNIQNELTLLNNTKMGLTLEDRHLAKMISDLAEINQSLWDIEDSLREKERRQEFDAEFISLARSVYRENDKRAKVKRHINDYLCSELVEEKSYSDY